MCNNVNDRESSYYAEKASISSIAFHDRRLGFFERNENLTIDISFKLPKDSEETYVLEITDAYGNQVKKQPVLVKPGEIKKELELGNFPLGWYRVNISLSGQTKSLCDYMAFVFVPSLSEREHLCKAISADVAAEYEPKTMAYGDEFIRTLRLQGFDWIRSRTNMTEWSDQICDYRKKVYDAGFKVTSASTDDMYNMPKIGSMDLRDVYKKYNEAPSKNSITNDMYELQNESDLFFENPALPDSLSAYSKAAFLGLYDSDCSPLLSMTSMAFSSDSIYYELMLQNGILDYSNIYNFHGYDGIESKAAFARKSVLAYSPKNNLRPSFMTENGIKVWADEDGVVFFNQMINMCCYAVKSCAKILSEGCDNWFWFIARAFLEAGGGFGNMHAWTHQPYPISATLSNLTFQLGLAKYLGKLSCKEKSTFGYVFDRGEDDVIVLFSSDESEISIHAESVVIADIFGCETEYSCDDNNVVTIKSGTSPIFVRIHGRLDEREYFKSQYEVVKCSKNNFKTADRVVLNAIWTNQNLLDSMIMQKGYLLEETDIQKISLRVYNFNDNIVCGKVFVVAEYADHFDITIDDPDFIIEPLGRKDIPITIKTTGKAIMNSSGDIKFSAILSTGEEVSAAVCRYWFKVANLNVSNDDIIQFEDFQNSDNWNLKNIMSPGKIKFSTCKKDKSITFNVDYCGKYVQWLFPEYRVLNPQIFEGADGIVLRMKNSSCSKSKLTSFVCTKDGRSYWSGDSSGVEFDTEWRTIVYPWDSFILFSSPEGFNDPRPFDPKDIYKVRIGVSGNPENSIPDITIKDFGIYYDRINASKPHPGEIIFSGIEEGHTYSSSNGLYLSALLPHDVTGDIRVILGKKEYSSWTIANNMLTIDLSKLKRGEYVLQVSGKTETNYRYIKYVSFNIEGT